MSQTPRPPRQRVSLNNMAPSFASTPEPLPARRCGICKSLRRITVHGRERVHCWVIGYTHDLRCCECFELDPDAKA